MPSYSPLATEAALPCEFPAALASPIHSIFVAPKETEDVLRMAIVRNESAYLEGG